jgi:hypothetical protein
MTLHFKIKNFERKDLQRLKKKVLQGETTNRKSFSERGKLHFKNYYHVPPSVPLGQQANSTD